MERHFKNRGRQVRVDVFSVMTIHMLTLPSWFIDVPRETAKQRLVERHIEAGIETSRISASRRVEDNDIPNGEFIKARLIQPNITLLN